MLIYNSLNICDVNLDESLYLVRYSQKNHPDFVIVRYKGFIGDRIKYLTKKGIIKKINFKKASYRLFSNIDEMARSLYECFILRNLKIIEKYKNLFLESQDNRPELWV